MTKTVIRIILQITKRQYVSQSSSKKEAAYKEVSMEVDKALKVVVVCVECAASVVAIIKN